MAKYYDESIETASRETIRQIQSENLIKTVKLIYDRVPLYRNRMDEAGVKPEDIKSVDDLHLLPFTYKQDLRDTYPYGMFTTDMDNVVRLHASSGTTGKQIVVGYTEKDIDMWASCVARALTAYGATKSDIVHVSYGYGLFTGGLGAHDGAQKLGATVIPVSTGNTARQITILQDFKPTVICGTPSYALHLIEALHEAGLSKDDISLKIGVFGAEPWTDEMRVQIEEGLGIKAYDIYGLTEICGPGVSFNCECQSGLHINEDHFIPEIIDPDTGEVLPDGQVGELVFSAVTKEAFPILRYRTRDICMLSHEKCSCGRTLVKMAKPQGRSDDMLIIRGVNVFPSQIESVLLSFSETTPNYMLIVDRVNNSDTLEIQVELGEEMFKSDEVKHLLTLQSQISEKVKSTLGISAKITFVEPKTLARTEGKAKRTIDKRKLY
ncbi:MAG: phenylacetate--CoA ligase [Firmicutes bacterium]|nr:phenylacetate--CoA ligase [Bacillota bacterium]